ncbi:MAG: hypothetical protein M1831_002714 [Alyxoria varia]|nr:MAG: hypothetical protein M1831_002714 [Alyxoria varia]
MYEPGSFIAVSISLTVLGLVAVLLRAYVRTKLRPGNLGFDDLFIVIGTVNGGLGRHTQLDDDGAPLLDDRTTLTLKVIYAQDIIEKLAYGCIKLSFLFFYRRIFVTGVSTLSRIFTDVMIALVALWAFSLFVAEVFVCGGHPKVFWSYDNVAERKTSCVNTSVILLVFAVTDVLGDLLIMGLPLQRVWRLNKSLKDKIGLALIFSLGLISTIAGIVRLVFVVEAYRDEYGQAGDILGSTSPPFMWTIVESSVGVIAACLPALPPLFTSRQPQGPIQLDHYNAAAGHGKHSTNIRSRGVGDRPQPDQPAASPRKEARHEFSTFSKPSRHPMSSSHGRDNRARHASGPQVPSLRNPDHTLDDFGLEGERNPLNRQESGAQLTPSISLTEMLMEGP